MASSVATAMMAGSMTMRPYVGDVVGVQREGNVGPKMGIKAPEMWSQKVAQTARAQE